MKMDIFYENWIKAFNKGSFRIFEDDDLFSTALVTCNQQI